MAPRILKLSTWYKDYSLLPRRAALYHLDLTCTTRQEAGRPRRSGLDAVQFEGLYRAG